MTPPPPGAPRPGLRWIILGEPLPRHLILARVNVALSPHEACPLGGGRGWRWRGIWEDQACNDARSAALLFHHARAMASSRSCWPWTTPGKHPGAPPFPDTEPPRNYGTTIAEVALDGGFPAAGYEERVRSWAADTTSAWQAAI